MNKSKCVMSCHRTEDQMPYYYISCDENRYERNVSMNFQ